MAHNNPKPVFHLARQRPNHDPDEVEHLGEIEYHDVLRLVRAVDWRREENQAEWAKKAMPSVAVTNQCDRCTFWVSAIRAASFIDVECEPDEELRTDPNEPWFSVSLENAPEIANVVAIRRHLDGESLGFTTASIETVGECFELFFDEDYESLYALFRWV